MNLIVCVNEVWAIGDGNRLMYNIPQDMQYFKTKTFNKVVIMGRKTYQSLRVKPLPNRYNVVLSSSLELTGESLTVCRNVQEVYEVIEKFPTDDVFIIGGAEVYRTFLDVCTTAYVTKVYDHRSADVYFPLNLDSSPNWSLCEKSQTYTFDGLNYSFNVYRRTTEF
jgi:dihydrofolate reductase